MGTVLPCCILLLCCGAGGAIPLFLRKKKPVAAPAHVYQTPYAQPQPVPLATAAVPMATATRPMTTMPITTGVPVATVSDACDDVDGSIRGARCASHFLRWVHFVSCQSAKGALDTPVGTARHVGKIIG